MKNRELDIKPAGVSAMAAYLAFEIQALRPCKVKSAKTS
jgi:hypothetical protein